MRIEARKSRRLMDDDDQLHLISGQLYARRREIHARFGGQWIRGISPSSVLPVIFLFSGGIGPEIGYPDGWRSENLYLFHGEGRAGDQRMVAGNARIRDAEANGDQLLLFHRNGRAPHTTFLGVMTLRDIEMEQVPDITGASRWAYRFLLERVADDCLLRRIKNEDVTTS